MALSMRERFRAALERGLIAYRREVGQQAGPSAREAEVILGELDRLLENLEAEHRAEVRTYQDAERQVRTRVTELEERLERRDRDVGELMRALERVRGERDEARGRLEVGPDDDLEGIPTILERLERVASNLEARELGLDEGRPRTLGQG